MDNLSKKLLYFAVPLGLIAVLGLFFWTSYTKLVNLDEDTNIAWAQVETQYQRRFDLVPQVVSTIKGATDHESEMLEKVTEARKSYNTAQENVKKSGDVKAQNELLEATENYTNSVGTMINVVNENYPQISSTELFQNLITITEGTENRISVERRRFNDSVGKYNKSVRKNLLSSMMGFERKETFKASTGSEEAPSISFE